jgi:replicative DNA helicase
MSDFDFATPALLPEPDLLPNSPEAELGWLGCMLQDAHVAMDGCGWLTQEHFYSLDHLVLFGVLREMYAESRPIDLVTVKIHLQRKRLLEAAGGFETLSKCLDSAPSPANGPYYAGILREKWALREALEAARGVLEGVKVSQDPLAFVRAARAKFEGIAQEMEDSGEIQSLYGKEAAEMLLTDVNEHAARAGQGPEISTGLKDLDKVTGGLHRSEMLVIGARPSIGKTALLLTMSHSTGQIQKVPSLFITLESPIKAILRRLACGNAGHSLGHYRCGFFQDRDLPRFLGEAVRLKESPLYFVGQNPKKPRTVDDIRAIIRWHVRKYGVRVVYLDYLSKVKPSGRAREKMTYEIGDISTSLHNEAEGSEVALVVAHQLNREAEKEQGKKDRMPSLKDLADSGQIERDADTVILIHREREKKEGPAVLIVPKQRDGETDIVKTHYIGKYTRFYNADYGSPDEEPESMQGHP